MRIGIIHATQNAVEPLNQAFHELNAEVELLNFVNEELLAHANRVGGIDSYGLRMFLKTVFQAVDANVDGILIACTIYCPYCELVSQLADVPVLAVDQPMIAKAVAEGKKIGILATTPSSAPSAEKKLEKEALAQEKTIIVKSAVVPEAMQALKRNHVQEHNRLLKEAGYRLKQEGCDILLLAQITMACAKKECDDLGLPVLSSPLEGASRMLELVKNRENGRGKNHDELK